MKSLKEALKEADRARVIEDVVALIDSEVRSKSGLTGVALKGGYKVVKKLKGGRMIHLAADALLDAFTDAIEPIHQEFRDGASGGTFEVFLAKNESRASNALLGITDKRAEKSDHKVLRKTYGKLRPQADKHVRAALPGVGRLADRYTAES